MGQDSDGFLHFFCTAHPQSPQMPEADTWVQRPQMASLPRALVGLGLVADFGDSRYFMVGYSTG